MSTFSNENHVTRGFTSDAINEFAFRLEASLVPHMSDIVKLKKQHAVLLGIEQEMDRFVFYYR